MCQINTFMFKASELDGEKIIEITKVFHEAGFTNFYEYTNPKLRNIRRDLRTFHCGNICDCGSVITKKVVVDEMMENIESEKLSEIIAKCLNIVDTAYLFAHWYKGNTPNEKVVLERAPRVVDSSHLGEDTYRSMFYNEVLEIHK
ncbi:MAG: hypothetical protein E7356_02320 [Clostridiales bacterium]|nr:hypothetical protein [Clostridiales bacterium]